MTEDRVRHLVIEHFPEVQTVILVTGAPGVCLVEISSAACDSEAKVIRLENRVAEWIMGHDERPAGVAFKPARMVMEPLNFVHSTITITTDSFGGRFATSDNDYGIQLAMAAAATKAAANKKLQEMRAKAEAEARACKAMAMGWNCELPNGHGGPHQIHDADNGYRHWDDAGRPVEPICYGPEGAGCSGLIYSRRQNSAYEKDSSNFTFPVCDVCFNHIQEAWSEQWDEYHAGLL